MELVRLAAMATASLAALASIGGTVLEDATFKLDMRGGAVANTAGAPGLGDAKFGDAKFRLGFLGGENTNEKPGRVLNTVDGRVGYFGDCLGEAKTNVQGEAPKQLSLPVALPWYFGVTNEQPCLEFYQSTNPSNPNQSARTSVVFQDEAVTGEVVTVYARIRWDGDVPDGSDINDNYFLLNATSNGWGAVNGFALTLTKRSDGRAAWLKAKVQNKLCDPKLLVLSNEWTDVFVTIANNGSGCTIDFSVCKTNAFDGSGLDAPELATVQTTHELPMVYSPSFKNLVFGGGYHEFSGYASPARGFRGAFADLALLDRALTEDEKLAIVQYNPRTASAVEDAVFELGLDGGAHDFTKPGDVTNRRNPAQTGWYGDAEGPKFYSPEYGTLPAQEPFAVEDRAEPGVTNEISALRFYQDEVGEGEQKHIMRTGVVFPGAAATGDVVSVYARFRWEGPCKAGEASCPYYFLLNGCDAGWTRPGIAFCINDVTNSAGVTTHYVLGTKIGNEGSIDTGAVSYRNFADLQIGVGEWVDFFATASNSVDNSSCIVEATLYAGGETNSQRLTVAEPMQYQDGQNCTNLTLATYHVSYVNAVHARCFRGAFADVRLWTRALDEADREEILAASLRGPLGCGSAYDYSAAAPTVGWCGDASGPKPYSTAYGRLPSLETADVQNPFYAYTTNETSVLRFYQDHSVVDDEDRTTRTGVVFPGAAATGDVVTVYTRFRWDGVCPAVTNTTPYYILQNGNKSGWSDFGFSLMIDQVDVSGDTTNACIAYKVSDKSARLTTFPVRQGEWVDLFATASNSASGKCDLSFKMCRAVANGANFNPPTLVSTNFTVNANMRYPASENSTNLVLGTYHESFANANISRCFKGAIADVMLWKRALAEEEMVEVMAGHHGAKWMVGAINGSAGEFDDKAPAAVYEPESMPWFRMRKSLNSAHPALSLASPLPYAETNRTMMLTIVPLMYGTSENVPVRLEVNGETVGTFNLASPYERNMRIPARFWQRDADGMVRVVVTRIGDLAGHVAIDALALWGSWQITEDNGKSTGDGMLDQQYAPNRALAGDSDPKHFGCAFSVGANHKKYSFGVWMPPGSSKACKWNFMTRATSRYASPGTARKFRLSVNGIVVADDIPDIAAGTSPFETLFADIPAGTLHDGMNWVEFKQTAPESGTDWMFFDFWGMTLFPPPPGMSLMCH